ncbi:hypothetical protein [Anaerotruncus massiliensis (ex Togo et al. 2019)]|uniref:hypothetical protein n=1 Tax=Anaerotruncus TaxID=244127 RepID=UPI000C78F817|nr:hypothetical protein [Anaerotruncus massiliensis (ex Togo et al. 2019)]
MTTERDTPREELVRNLMDAGCGPDLIARFLDCLREGGRKDQLKMLSGHRDALLDRIHRDERRIDCLDYLIYRIERDLISIPPGLGREEPI